MSKIKDRIFELLNSPIQEMRDLGKVLRDEERLKERIHLEELRKIQTKHPMIICGGSVALYLHGCKLKRLSREGDKSDLDLITPYYVSLAEEDEKGDLFLNVSKAETFEIPSSSDFHEINYANYAKSDQYKIDVRVDPHARYEKIVFEEFTYKVCKLEDILLAKIKYAKEGKKKHLDDVYEICGKEIKNEVEVVETPKKGFTFASTS